MAIDPYAALSVGSTIAKLTFGLFGSSKKKKRAKLELNTTLAQLSLEEQSLALDYANTFIEGQSIELQTAYNEWQSEFKLLQFNEEARQRNIDRAISMETTLAGLDKEKTLAGGRLEYARKAEIRARDSWAVREGLLESQYATNIGLIDERERSQIGQLERTKIRHDARLIVQAASSNLINRHLGRIRADQRGVYNKEISMVESSSDHTRAQEAFNLRMIKMDADERLVAFELNKELALTEYGAARQHAARMGRVQQYTDQELTNLGAWRGKVGDIVGDVSGPNLFTAPDTGSDPGPYNDPSPDTSPENPRGPVDTDTGDTDTGDTDTGDTDTGDTDTVDTDIQLDPADVNTVDTDIQLDPADVNTPGTVPGSDPGQDSGSDPGQDSGDTGVVRLDEVLDELEEETLLAIDEALQPDVVHVVKESALYKRYVSAVAAVGNHMLRYGPQRLSGAFGQMVSEALTAENALMAGLGVDELPFEESGQFTDWKPAALAAMRIARDTGKKGWRQSNVGIINAMEASGVEASDSWYSEAYITHRAQAVRREHSSGSGFYAGDYTNMGLGSSGRVQRSARLFDDPTGAAAPPQTGAAAPPQTDAAAPPQTGTSFAGQWQNYYASLDILDNSAATLPAAQTVGEAGIQEGIRNPPAGDAAGGSFATGPDGEAVPFVGAYTVEQNSGTLTPNTEAQNLENLQRRAQAAFNPTISRVSAPLTPNTKAQNLENLQRRAQAAFNPTSSRGF